MVMAAISDMLAPASVASVRSLQQRRSNDQRKAIEYTMAKVITSTAVESSIAAVWFRNRHKVTTSRSHMIQYGSSTRKSRD